MDDRLSLQAKSARQRLACTFAAVLILVTLGLSAPRPAAAATLPAGFTETTIASGLSSPTAMAIAPDGRIFVAEQTGRLRVIKGDALLAAPFVTLTVDASGERGLLGVAFDPNFSANQFVYLYYTTPSPSVHNRLSRFTANGDVVVPGSETVLLDLNNLSSATNHNGGAIHFGPDGKLYVAVGENANGANSQTLTNLLGKILRINADGSIPSDNPFFGSASGINRLIWSIGLRNPFTFAFQAGTGRMFVNDVGQSAWEEIDDGVAGANYGWPATEGTTSNPTFRSPLFVYGHGSTGTTGCAITGGAFYNPPTPQFPATYTGKYFFADYCGGWIRVFDPAAGTAVGFASGISAPVDLQVSADGSLYYLYRGSGAVNRIRYTASSAPSITRQPASLTVTVGQPASFDVAASGAAPLTYQWQRNGVSIRGATSPTYVIASAAPGDNGAAFRCVVDNGFGSATSSSATLTVTANTAPTATIALPAAGATYAAGDTISYAGTGTDPEDGTLPASAFTWQVDFRHDTHAHPFLPATAGSTTGSFVVPTSGETAANVWYRIYLTVRDGPGLTHTAFRDVMPRTTTITLASVRSGLQLTLDGRPVTTPYTEQGVAGMVRAIGVTSPQTVTGTPWTFAGWSDGGAANHSIVTPATNTTYTATFTPQIAIPANETLIPLLTITTITDMASGEPPRAAGAPPVDLAPANEAVGAPLPRPFARAYASREAQLARAWVTQRSHSWRFWWDTTPGAALSRILRLRAG